MVERSILQLYKTTIFLEQLQMVASNNLFNKCDQEIRQLKNQIITHQIPEKKLYQLYACEMTALFFRMAVGYCNWRAPSPERITISL